MTQVIKLSDNAASRIKEIMSSALDIISFILLAALSLNLITWVIDLALVLRLLTFYLYPKVGPRPFLNQHH